MYVVQKKVKNTYITYLIAVCMIRLIENKQLYVNTSLLIDTYV